MKILNCKCMTHNSIWLFTKQSNAYNIRNIKDMHEHNSFAKLYFLFKKKKKNERKNEKKKSASRNAYSYVQNHIIFNDPMLVTTKSQFTITSHAMLANKLERQPLLS